MTQTARSDNPRAAGFSPRGFSRAVSVIGHERPRRLKPAAQWRLSERRCAENPPGFTLIEMIVVISIILIILGLVLPAANTLWEERKSAEAENTVQGLFMTARAKALEADAVETGLFFFMDNEGVQRIVTIAKAEPPSDPDPATRASLQIAYQHVFEITDERDYILPAPIRAVPRYVVDPQPPAATHLGFNVDELVRGHRDFGSLPSSGVDSAQRHRNYFTMVFDTDGQLLVARGVIVQDVDEDEDELGDRTGLDVGPGPPDPTAVQYYQRDSTEVSFDLRNTNTAVEFPVWDTKKPVAINFPSVDGLLVYDDSLFAALPGQTPADREAKREFLLRTGQPFYISRWTGVVVRGPLGENVP